MNKIIIVIDDKTNRIIGAYTTPELAHEAEQRTLATDISTEEVELDKLPATPTDKQLEDFNLELLLQERFKTSTQIRWTPE